MIAESLTLPGYFHGYPLVLTPDARLPAASRASTLTVPETAGGDIDAIRSSARRRYALSPGPIFASAASIPAADRPSRHIRDASSVSVGPRSMPTSSAKRSAPAATSSRCCGSRSQTARAIEIGCGKPVTTATAPARRVAPSMIEASSSTSPSKFGSPPTPTWWSASLDSTTRTAASTASSALPPARSRLMPAASPTSPPSLAIIIGVIAVPPKTLPPPFTEPLLQKPCRQRSRSLSSKNPAASVHEASPPKTLPPAFTKPLPQKPCRQRSRSLSPKNPAASVHEASPPKLCRQRSRSLSPKNPAASVHEASPPKLCRQRPQGVLSHLRSLTAELRRINKLLGRTAVARPIGRGTSLANRPTRDARMTQLHPANRANVA